MDPSRTTSKISHKLIEIPTIEIGNKSRAIWIEVSSVIL